jgi:GNAT superfamily N-acetyltransferase
VLQAAGYRITDRLPAVILDLADFKPLPLRGLDYDDQGDMRTLARINAAAYGRQEMATMFPSTPQGVDLRVYQARVGGEPAAVLCMIDVESDHGMDCVGSFVATDPGARHVGLAPRLLSAALLDARARGCITCSGQASQAGARIYSRMGFRTPFHYDRYEWGGA